MIGTTSFGQWLKRRRKALDITQEELAQQVGCAVITIYKIEADERRPSKQITQLLAQHLAIPASDHTMFVKFARIGPKAVAAAMPWGTPFHPPTNLPVLPTPLIGREQDIADVRKLLLRHDTHLLTLLGPPGIGKTRLSLAVAGEVIDEFSDGVFLILLAPVSDPEAVLRTIVQTLGLQETGPQSSLERLTYHLRDKQMLLVLDNFEQVLAAATDLADLLAVCPFVKFLVTSRAPLRIRRERQYLVPALALPDERHLSEIEVLPTYAAIELFVERAQAVQHGFELTHDNAKPITAICHRLDGLPLAIELISARIKLLSPAALLDRLHGQLMLHSDGLRDLEPRHHTLNAAIGWSYDLLNAKEKTLFVRLAVFVDGWTMEAVEEVCQPQINTLDGMASLLDKCLIQQSSGVNDQPRFSMLETIREYAVQRLEESASQQSMHHRHADYFLNLIMTPVGDSPPALPQPIYLNLIEQDYSNIRAALEWCLTSDLVLGLRLATICSGYWLLRGRLIEWRFWIEKYLEFSRQSADVAEKGLRRLHVSAGNQAYFQNDLPALRRHAKTMLELGEPSAFFLLGQDALLQEKFDEARSLFEKCLVQARQLGRDEQTASTLLMCGLAAEGHQDYARALALNSESLAMYRQLGNRWHEAVALCNSADVLILEGNYQEARALCRESLYLNREIDDRRSLARILDQFAQLIDLEGNPLRATQIMGAAEVMREALSVPVEPLEHTKYKRLIKHLRTELDDSAFDRAWAEGRLMTLDWAIEYALSE